MPTKRKMCSSCMKSKLAAAFNVSSNHSSGLQSWCRACMKARTRKRSVLKHTCENCSQVFNRVALPPKAEALRPKRCFKCLRQDALVRSGGRPHNYRGSKYFSARTILNWQASAERRGYSWHLVKEQLDVLYDKQQGVCALSGLKMSMTEKRYRVSLDRIKSDKPYTIDNVQFVCAVLNTMKNNLPEEEFVRLCGLVASNRQGGLQCR